MPINDLTVDESGRVTGTIADQAGTGFQPTTLNFWLYDQATKKILNSRTDVALTPIGTYVSTGGALTHTLTRSDMVLNNSALDQEIHVLRYKWTYNTTADAGIAELEFKVSNLATLIS